MVAPNCVDMSKWGKEFTDAEAACMKAAGIRLVIVNTVGPVARQQMEMATRHGFLLEAYRYLLWGIGIDYQVQLAQRACEGFPVRRLWLDAESEDVGKYSRNRELRARQLAALLRRAVVRAEQFHPRKAGIYTGRWWWSKYMPGVTEFGHLPLWNAWYDKDPDEDGLPYGGWEHSAIEQYCGTTVFCGQSVDLNYAKPEYLDGN